LDHSLQLRHVVPRVAQLMLVRHGLVFVVRRDLRGVVELLDCMNGVYLRSIQLTAVGRITLCV